MNLSFYYLQSLDYWADVPNYVAFFTFFDDYQVSHVGLHTFSPTYCTAINSDRNRLQVVDQALSIHASQLSLHCYFEFEMVIQGLFIVFLFSTHQLLSLLLSFLANDLDLLISCADLSRLD